MINKGYNLLISVSCLSQIETQVDIRSDIYTKQKSFYDTSIYIVSLVVCGLDPFLVNHIATARAFFAKLNLINPAITRCSAQSV